MRNQINIAFMLILLGLIGYLMYQIMAPFLIALFVAYIFSHLFRSWYEAINLKMKGRKSIASFFTCILIILILIVPLVLVSLMVVSEVNQLIDIIRHNGLSNYIKPLLDHPLLDRFGISQETLLENQRLSNAAENVGNFFFEAIKKTYQSASHFLFMTVVMFFTLYYFFKDGDSIQKKIMELSPLKSDQEQLLVDRFVSISKATLKGSLVIAIIQGSLLGLLFWITGVISPVFWALITVFFSLIPMLGSAVVWLPAGVIMLATGNVWQGIAILAFGGLVISSVDNFLRPALVGNQVSLHPLFVFFATLGGVALFGIVGVLIGPVIAVLFITLLGMYKEEFHTELERLNQ